MCRKELRYRLFQADHPSLLDKNLIDRLMPIDPPQATSLQTSPIQSSSRSPSPAHHPRNKACTLCSHPRPVLVRCQIEDTGQWHFLCPGQCWRSVSGGVEDAKGHEGKFPFYRYGGMCESQDNSESDHILLSLKLRRDCSCVRLLPESR